jgi:hypothetical protein
MHRSMSITVLLWIRTLILIFAATLSFCHNLYILLMLGMLLLWFLYIYLFFYLWLILIFLTSLILRLVFFWTLFKWRLTLVKKSVARNLYNTFFPLRPKPCFNFLFVTFFFVIWLAGTILFIRLMRLLSRLLLLLIFFVLWERIRRLLLIFVFIKNRFRYELLFHPCCLFEMLPLHFIHCYTWVLSISYLSRICDWWCWR